MAGPRRIRIGVDTGGTFTDVVAFDEATGEDVTAVCHGTPVATNLLLEGKVDRLGFVTTEGFEFLLEIARQSVPDGYGNSYFWVKPPRIVPADLVRTVGGRLDHRGAELRPFDEPGARSVARWFRGRGVVAIGVCFLHAYANPDHEERMRAVLEAEHPDAVVSLSSEVLREYREYERAMTTLVDAAVKPRVSRYVATIRRRLAEFAGPAAQPVAAATSQRSSVPFLIMKSNGGVVPADEVVHQPITTVLSGPAAGALGAAEIG